MSEKRQNKFYKIVRKESYSEIYKGNTIITTLNCEDLVQCDTALVAKEKSGKYSVYLPVYKGKEIIRLIEDVKEYYYYKKENSKFEEGFLFLKVETGPSCGFWTAIYLKAFKTSLTHKKLQEKRFQMPYNGDSEIDFLKEINYSNTERTLFNRMFVKIDDVVYLIEEASLYNLGKAYVHPSFSFKDLYKVKSVKGESIFDPEYPNKPLFGPFHKIDKVIIKHRKPFTCEVYLEDKRCYTEFACYFAYNKDDLLVAILHEKHLSMVPDWFRHSDTFEMFLLPTPVRKAEFINQITLSSRVPASADSSCCDSSISIWKLTYCDNSTKIIFSALSNDLRWHNILDFSDFI